MHKISNRLRTYGLVMLLMSVSAASCRSRAIPCPSFSSISQADGHQLGHGKAMKYDRDGRVKK